MNKNQSAKIKLHHFEISYGKKEISKFTIPIEAVNYMRFLLILNNRLYIKHHRSLSIVNGPCYIKIDNILEFYLNNYNKTRMPIYNLKLTIPGQPVILNRYFIGYKEIQKYIKRINKLKNMYFFSFIEFSHYGFKNSTTEKISSLNIEISQLSYLKINPLQMFLDSQKSEN